MADKSTSTPQQLPPDTPLTAQGLADAFASALKSVQPKERITIANRVPRTPFNPENKPRKLKKDYYQNYDKIDPDVLYDVEFELLQQIKPGTYLDERVEVIEVSRGVMKGIHIRYDNSSIDKRMAFQTIAPTLEALLRNIIAEQKRPKPRDED